MKFSLVLLTMALALPGHAQKRGDTFVGLSFIPAYMQTRDNGKIISDGFGFSLHPSFGWFPIKHLGIGVQLDAYRGRYNGKNTTVDSHASMLGGSFVIRDYLHILPRLYRSEPWSMAGSGAGSNICPAQAI